MRLSLNKYKFEEKLLYKLKNFIIKYYNKKVEFNIVNIRSVVFHTDFFTKILTSKLLNRKANILAAMDTILNKVVLPKVNRIVEKSLEKKSLNLLENKYKYLNLSFILNKNNNLSKVLNKLYHNIIMDYYNNNLNKDFFRIYEIIFNSINYKNMAGVRLEAKGRLTKRYRADRAVFKVRWKGSLENIDSSYKGLSSVNYRGYQKANMDYTLLTGKRRIGAFAVKGWISGKSYSTLTNPSTQVWNDNISPWSITGFSDGEGSFLITVYKDNTRSTGWAIKLRFKIGLHNRDLFLLEGIRKYFNGGTITSGDYCVISFESLKDLDVVIKHFDSYPLITKKHEDYLLFKQAYEMLKNKEHLTIVGLKKIVAIKASLNKGLSEELKLQFSDVKPVIRPIVLNQNVPKSEWLAGFVSAEGCFLARIGKNSKVKTGLQVQLVLHIGQHERDLILMKNIMVYLDCGKILIKKRDEFAWVDLSVSKFSDIKEKIIPFFKSYKILGTKSHDFLDFCEIAELMEEKAHLTPSGLEKILKLKEGMNKGRVS